jgi:phosphohistidine phosphatase
MTLYLMRHAEAEDLGALNNTGNARDANRCLTDKGRRQARRMALLLKRLDVKIDRVFASPFTRAQETARLIISALGLHTPIRTLDELKPNGKEDAMWSALRAAGDEGHLLVVGHLPSIANLAGSLLGSLAEEPIWFHKSSLAALHCEAREGRKPRVRLEWMASPALAKRLASRRSAKRASPQPE